MPKIIRTIEQIIAQEKRDMLFITFDHLSARSGLPNSSRQRHLDWFDAKKLHYELAAPEGWLEGDPGIYAVYFDGLDDPRIKEYSSIFEDESGKSLIPEGYQIVIIAYA